jgi:hypothetical protein
MRKRSDTMKGISPFKQHHEIRVVGRLVRSYCPRDQESENARGMKVVVMEVQSNEMEL